MESNFILIFVAFAAIAGLAAYFANEAAKRRRAAFVSLAQRIGFTFYEQGLGSVHSSSFLGLEFHSSRDSIVGTFEGFDLFRQGENQRAAPVLVGEIDGIHYYLFDYKYETTSRDSEGRSSTTTHPFSVVAARTPFMLPSLSLSPQGFLDNLGKVFGRREIEVESAEFNRRYFIQSPDPRATLDLLHPMALEHLLQCDVRPWQAGGMYLFTFRAGHRDPAEYAEMLDQVRGLLNLVPAYVREDSGISRPFASPTEGLS